MSGGGGGLDIGKEFAQLDKDLSLSQNAIPIAALGALAATGGMAGIGIPGIAGLGGGAGAAGAAAGAGGLGLSAGTAGAAGAGGLGAGIGTGLGLGAAEAAGASTLAGAGGLGFGAGTAGMAGTAGGLGAGIGTGLGLGAAEAAGASTLAGAGTAGGLGLGTAGMASTAGGLGAGIGAAAPAATTSGFAGMYNSAKDLATQYPKTAIALGLGAAALMADRNKGGVPEQKPYDGPLSQLRYDPNRYQPLEVKPPTPYTPVYKDYRNMFGGGLTSIGEQIKRLAQEQEQAKYSTPPLSYDPARYDAEAGTKMVARPGMARGGIADLGGYSDGGRMLKGPGDGMSDSIPATISNRQPARLADGEFVIPADVVSHLGNGSTDAGAKQLYKMMDKIRVARTGKKRQGRQINPRKYMPA